jgi:hypothetical protein
MALRAGVVCVVAIVAQAPSPALALRAMPAPHLRAVASGAYPLTPLSSLITTARACLHSVSFFPYGKDGFAPLPLPGSGSPHRTGLLPQQESARSQARSCSACTSPSACCASSLRGIARDGWGALWRQGQCPPLRSGWRRLGTSRGYPPALDAPTQGLASVLVVRCSVTAPPRGGVRSCQSVDVGSRHCACSTGTLAPGRAGVVRRSLWGLGAPKPLPGRSGLLFA